MRAKRSSDGREEALEFHRLLFFSDAVFAIAITLLVLDLKLPPGSHGVVRLDDIGDKIVGFALSFAVIGLYWLGHHRLFSALKADDFVLRLVNLAFLGGIVFLPFPTGVIAEYPATPDSVRLYALSVFAVGMLLTALIVVARRPPLLRSGETRGGTIRSIVYALAPPAVFLASALVAGSDPALAMNLWWLVIPALFAAAMIGRRIQAVVDRPARRAPAAR